MSEGGAEAAAVGADPLAERLAELLPADCRRVLLLAEGPAVARRLRERGCEVAAEAGLAGEAGGPFDAAVLLPGAVAADGLAARLEGLRGRLADKGRVVLAVAGDGGVAASGAEAPAAPEALAAAVVALSEAGFAILRQERLETPGAGGAAAGAGLDLLVARREAYRVREYRPGDEIQILPIFEGSFHVRRTLERWSWEYRENPYGNLVISEAFDETGQLVAHYAGYPVRLRDRGEPLPLPALQVGDTFTLPAVRHVGRGPTSLLGRTVRHFYARYCEGRVAFNYGFNTGNIQRFSMAFVGARRLEDLPFLALPLAAGRPASLPTVARWLGGWSAGPAGRLDARFDAFFAAVAPAYGLLVERDARYLDWRYGRCPDGGYVTLAAWRRGELAGWGVFRRRDERLLWGDALVDPARPEAARLLLAAALALPAHQGVERVETWGCERPAWWRPLLLDLGFAPQPEPQGLGLVFVPFATDPEAAFRERLHYAMGDSDLF